MYVVVILVPINVPVADWRRTGRGDQRSKRSSGRRSGLKVHSILTASVISDVLLFAPAPVVPRIWQRFKLSFIICFMAIAMMIVMQSNAVPFEWQIATNYALTIPLSLVVGCHILLPVRLPLGSN
jgi:hypothetical protein